MPCNISQNAIGAAGGGHPARSSREGYPGGGGTLARGGPWLGGVPLQGVPWWGGTLARGLPWPGGGTQLGQHREYLLHDGRYASCVHAGGLSCRGYLFINKAQMDTIGYFEHGLDIVLDPVIFFSSFSP